MVRTLGNAREPSRKASMWTFDPNIPCLSDQEWPRKALNWNGDDFFLCFSHSAIWLYTQSSIMTDFDCNVSAMLCPSSVPTYSSYVEGGMLSCTRESHANPRDGHAPTPSFPRLCSKPAIPCRVAFAMSPTAAKAPQPISPHANRLLTGGMTV